MLRQALQRDFILCLGDRTQHSVCFALHAYGLCSPAHTRCHFKDGRPGRSLGVGEPASVSCTAETTDGPTWSRLQAFADAHGFKRAHGSYEELAADTEVCVAPSFLLCFSRSTTVWRFTLMTHDCFCDLACNACWLAVIAMACHRELGTCETHQIATSAADIRST